MRIRRTIHILLADPLITKYVTYSKQTSFVTVEQRHVVPGITLDALPRDRLGGILFSKLTILAGLLYSRSRLPSLGHILLRGLEGLH